VTETEARADAYSFRDRPAYIFHANNRVISGDDITFSAKVGYISNPDSLFTRWADNGFLYYTTDGSEPQGSLGSSSGTTSVIPMQFKSVESGNIEVSTTGARAMIADGLFDRFPCDEVYALHNSPELPAGHVGIPASAARSSADDINITIRANGAHGSMPHLGEDAVAAAAHFITAVQQAATRLVDARASGVISFGLLQGGTARNILPDTVRIEGTMRTTATDVRDRLADLLQDAAHATELMFGVLIEAEVNKVAPVTLNDPACVAATVASAIRTVGTDRVVENARSLMASEDFSEFLGRVPGAFFFVGQGGYAPHHPKFIFDPDIIPVGAAIFAELAMFRTSRTLNSHHLN
jgi:hippurate hydrolase